MVKPQYPRFIADRVTTALADTPVVGVIGARQTGKSTLVRELVRLPRGATYVTFDDPLPLAAARADPDGFLDGYGVPLVLDEAQRVPGIFRAVKRSVDRDRRPGRFLLTGSADILHLPRISESLAGRIELITLWPLSQGELGGRKETFIDDAFSAVPLSGRGEAPRSLLERVLRGGFPTVVDRDVPRRAEWFESYVATVVQREVGDIATIERLADLPRLVRLMAARSATILNVADVSRATGIQHTTLTRYLTLLDLAYLTLRMPAWTGSAARRLVKHPKVVMADSGLAAQLVGADRDRLRKDGRTYGQLLETFVAMELRKQLGWSKTRATLHHYRSGSGIEVDILLERTDGKVVAIEVKAAEKVEPGDANALRSIADIVGDRFHRGIVLYAGADAVPLGRSIHAVPIASLWS
jgi:predicted AAA+ superfamily ATPase